MRRRSHPDRDGVPIPPPHRTHGGMDLRPLDQFAREHHGLVTRRAFALAGIPDRSWYRALELGLLEPVHPGVARMIGSDLTVAQRICAAVLGAGRDAMASHRSAAFLWGIPRPGDDPIDVLLPRRERGASVAGAELHRPRDLRDLTPVLRTGIRTTNILRTLCDLGALDAAAVQPAVGHVVTTGLASPAALTQGRRPTRGDAAGRVCQSCAMRSTTGCSTASRLTACSSRRCDSSCSGTDSRLLSSTR